MPTIQVLTHPSESPILFLSAVKGEMKMHAQVFEGYFAEGKFYAGGKPLSIPERRKVYVTILDEPMQITPPVSSTGWLNEFNNVLENSGDNKLRHEDFPRMDFGREFILFADEEK
jgi:hypothetical protein